MPVPGFLNYSSLVIKFDIRYCDPSYFVLLPQSGCSYLGSFMVPINFCSVCSISVKYVMDTLIGFALNLYIALGSMDILMMLILQSMNMVYSSINLYLPQFLSSVFYRFPITVMLPPWLNLFLGTLFFCFYSKWDFFS